ncbi:Major facilitator superfamily domain-containing protein 6-A [Folsomia candida]|uniref:Major facilitator superfamily domain-containing protein 6-A n=1 Tax=Folsomia candida TaxID=158441 RepID=A0A226ETP4_FOLCA|nr:Major facilitator superfamily domain-containing protein 6-A [Folsomia candida]
MHLDVLGLDGDGWNDVALLQLLEMGMLSLSSSELVLGICLLLAGLLYPLIMAVPPAEPFRYRDRIQWCKETLTKEKLEKNDPLLGNAYTSSASCVPNRLVCPHTSTYSELISDHGGCSDRCSGKLLISGCHFKCNDSMDYDYDDGPSAQRQTSPREDERAVEDESDFGTSPHLCVKDDPHFKYKNLCFAFDKYMHEIPLQAAGISGYADTDGKCHYPLIGSSESGEQRSLLSCSPVSPHCHVSCDLRWDTAGEDDQWTCQSDFVQWFISFICFVGIHTLGTMLVISAAGLLNSAIVSMSHEHSGYFGCQYTYAALGYALVPPGTVLLFDLVHSIVEVPWKLEYLAAYSIWLFVCALLVFCLPYHAEWVPKPKTVGPMIRRWSGRGHSLMFFCMIAILGCFQILNDVLSFYQIKSVGGSLLLIAIGATATVAPALVFICRVEKVIDYCGHQNIFAIALVVVSLQFTGYAYLTDAEPEWSFLLKAMETFSVLMVWITASYTTYAAAPRSLVATCQTIVVTIYCCIGRGIGGIFGFIFLTFIPKDLLLKIFSLLAVFICVLFLMVHYCCLKPLPYHRHDHDRPGSAAPSGRYTPLKLINGKDKNLAKDEDLDEKEINAPDD